MLISMPKKLLEKIGEEAAGELIGLLNTFEQYSHDSVITMAEENFERRLSKEISKGRGEIPREISAVREELHRNQAAVIRWMFLFRVGQIGALLGILFAFFR